MADERWRYDAAAGRVKDENDLTVAIVAPVDPNTREDSEARDRDGRILAAAPEMLDALRACFVNGDPEEAFDPANPETERIIRAAVARAAREG